MNEYRQKLLKEIGINDEEIYIPQHYWSTISRNCKTSVEFIKEFNDLLNWKYLSYNKSLTEEIIREFANQWDWITICEYHTLSYEFVLDFKDKMVWHNYFKEQYADFLIMKKFIVKTNFYHINEFETFHLTEPQKEHIQKILDFKNLFSNK